MNDTNKALTAYEECIKHDPHHAQAHYQIGSLAAEQHNNDVAVEHLKKAIEYNPSYVNAHFNLGQVKHRCSVR